MSLELGSYGSCQADVPDCTMAVAPDCTMQGGQLVLEGQIPRVDVEALSYEAFRMIFMLNNQPVVVSNVANGWRASGEWKSADGKPDLAFLKDKFGASSVQVLCNWLSVEDCLCCSSGRHVYV
jgi:hypothetical protein